MIKYYFKHCLGIKNNQHILSFCQDAKYISPTEAEDPMMS